jgi:hypothetical protein
VRYAQPGAVIGPAVRVTTLLRLSHTSIRDTHTQPPVASVTMRSVVSNTQAALRVVVCDQRGVVELVSQR